MSARRTAFGRTAFGLAASAVLGAAAALLGAAACTDFDAPDPKVLSDVAVANPSFTNDIMPIFEARCATAGCHTNETRQNNVALEPLDTAYVHARRLVNTANPGNSFLVCVLREPCAQSVNRPRMPLGQPPLSENQIQTIVNWIAQGAEKN
ncbi:MAG TPA: hypothetical protein VKA84_23420 [Gemmatimonadaceae bacterium]|nr:hypothetical protein [Gemmatimonadaceae bacterium]